ncbi:MAG: hypothetical protein SNJ84_03355 [Verrucomicrobiia bacterium]
MTQTDLHSLATLSLRLFACALIITALALWVHTALSDSFTLRQIPDHLAPNATLHLRSGEATLQTAALLGALGLFTLVLSRGLARFLIARIDSRQ